MIIYVTRLCFWVVFDVGIGYSIDVHIKVSTYTRALDRPRECNEICDIFKNRVCVCARVHVIVM